MNRDLVDARNPVSQLAKEVDNLDVRLENGLSVAEYNAQVDKLIKTFGGTITPAESLQQTLDGLDAKFGEGSAKAVAFGDALRQAAEASLDPFQSLRREVERLHVLFAKDPAALSRQLANLGKSAWESIDPLAAMQSKMEQFNFYLQSKIWTPAQYGKAVESIGKSVSEGVNPFAAYTSKMQELNLLLNTKNALTGQATISQRTYNEAARQARVAAGMELGAGMYGIADIGNKYQEQMLNQGWFEGGAAQPGGLGAGAGAIPPQLVNLGQQGNVIQQQQLAIQQQTLSVQQQVLYTVKDKWGVRVPATAG